MSSKDTWRELAEMLGLPADEPPPQTVKPEAPAPLASKADDAPIDDERLDVDDRAFDDDGVDPGIESSLAEHSPIERDEDDDEFFVPPLPADSSDDIEVSFGAVAEMDDDDEVVGESTEEPAEGKSADDRPREGRRRRRGRRGRRRGGDEAAEASPLADTLEGADGAVAAESDADNEVDEASPEGDDEPRGRRRQRRRDGNEAVVAAEEELSDTSSDDSDDFSKDAWADWNVPNWQELIDGLYRPDRDR